MTWFATNATWLSTRVFNRVLLFISVLCGFHPLAQAAPGDLLWTHTTSDQIRSSAALAQDGTIYFGDHDGFLNAMSSSGELLWQYQALTPGAFGATIIDSPVLAPDGTIYVSTSAGLHAVSPLGEQQWIYSSNFSGTRSAAVGPNGEIYVPRNSLHALDADGNLVWVFDGVSNISTSPVVAPDGTIYVGSFDDHLYAINPNGTLKWRFETGGDIAPPAIASQGDIVFGSSDGIVYMVDSDGTELWRFATGGKIDASPVISSTNTIYIPSWDKNFYALTPFGLEMWHFTTDDVLAATPTLGNDDLIYLPARDGNLYALDRSGNLVWSYDTGEWLLTSPLIDSTGTLYLGSTSKHFYAIETTATGLQSGYWPTLGHNAQRQFHAIDTDGDGTIDAKDSDDDNDNFPDESNSATISW
ncbi:MAG: hypothetical protein CMF25_07845 [Kangiellaceae bacterium]|nr:hypothetical protein [Kangiellaceae bacterium]|tara:strand:- start:1764 stop:3005 length:1242 start_codon:yes stop_codon:yes gene_type:complete